jgi:hypothetical protein
MRTLALLLLGFIVAFKATGQIAATPLDLKIFHNIEQIEFCIHLPLNEYAPPTSPIKACFEFKHKKNRNGRMSVQGFFKTTPAEKFEQYIESRYLHAANKQQKTLLKSEMRKEHACYYELYYLKGSDKAFRMLEMIWVRSDDVVILKVKFPVRELAIWQQRIHYLANLDLICPT